MTTIGEIPKEDLDRLPCPNEYKYDCKVLRIIRNDGVLGYRTYKKYRIKDKQGNTAFAWGNDFIMPLNW